jgi:hypothetical protein
MRYITGLICFVLSVTTCNAQFLKKLGEKVKNATEKTIERKVEEKTEKATEKVLDSVFESSNKTKNTQNRSNKTLNEDEPSNDISFKDFLNDSGETAFETKYIFPVTATIEVEDASNNLRKTTIKQGYGKEALINEMEKNGDPIILDMKNQSAIMLNINNGTAQVMSLKWMEKMMGNQNISSQEASDVVTIIKKTGKTKVMNGYTCHEYNITHEEGRINAWYAPDVKFDYQDYLRGMSKIFSKKKEENPIKLLNTDYGYVMEMNFYNAENKKQNSMKVIALDEKVRMINLDLFKIQKL